MSPLTRSTCNSDLSASFRCQPARYFRTDRAGPCAGGRCCFGITIFRAPGKRHPVIFALAQPKASAPIFWAKQCGPQTQTRDCELARMAQQHSRAAVMPIGRVRRHGPSSCFNGSFLLGGRVPTFLLGVDMSDRGLINYRRSELRNRHDLNLQQNLSGESYANRARHFREPTSSRTVCCRRCLVLALRFFGRGWRHGDL